MRVYKSVGYGQACVFDCVYVCMSVCTFLKLPVHDGSLENMRKRRNKEPFQTFPGMFESNEPLGTTTSWQDKASQVEGRGERLF